MKTTLRHTHGAYLLLLLIATILFANCKEEKEIAPYIEIKSVSTKVIPAQGGDIDIQFFSAKDWTVTADKDWVTINPSLGKGGTINMKVNVGENTTPDRRAASITFSSEYIQQSISITQKQKDSLSVASVELAMGANDTRFTIDIDTNVDNISTSSSAPWVKYLYKSKNTRAMEGYTLTFGLEKNDSFDPREALLSITGNEIDRKVKITQGGRNDSTFVYINHSTPLFTIPYISGDRVVGMVNWGDGHPQETYQKDLTHSYSTTGQDYRITLKVWGAKEIELPTIQGVTEVDLSEF